MNLEQTTGTMEAVPDARANRLCRSLNASLLSDKWHEKRRRFVEDKAMELRPYVAYFARFPSPVVKAMDLADFRRDNPDFPCRSVTYLKGKRTILRRKGML